MGLAAMRVVIDMIIPNDFGDAELLETIDTLTEEIEMTGDVIHMHVEPYMEEDKDDSPE